MHANRRIGVAVASHRQRAVGFRRQFQPVLLFVDILHLRHHPIVLKSDTDDPVIVEIRQPLLDQFIGSNAMQALGIVEINIVFHGGKK